MVYGNVVAIQHFECNAKARASSRSDGRCTPMCPLHGNFATPSHICAHIDLIGISDLPWLLKHTERSHPLSVNAIHNLCFSSGMSLQVGCKTGDEQRDSGLCFKKTLLFIYLFIYFHIWLLLGGSWNGAELARGSGGSDMHLICKSRLRSPCPALCWECFRSCCTCWRQAEISQLISPNPGRLWGMCLLGWVGNRKEKHLSHRL